MTHRCDLDVNGPSTTPANKTNNSNICGIGWLKIILSLFLSITFVCIFLALFSLICCVLLFASPNLPRPPGASLSLCYTSVIRLITYSAPLPFHWVTSIAANLIHPSNWRIHLFYHHISSRCLPIFLLHRQAYALIHWSGTTLIPSGGFNVVVERVSTGKIVTLVMTDIFLTTQWFWVKYLHN